MNGVSFNNMHSYDDYGLILNSKVISEPQPQTKLINVPNRNGSIDLSEVLTGNIRYNNRTISIQLTIMEPAANWETKRTELANELHGQKMKIVFDDDPAFYWYGRITVGDVRGEGSTASVTITADCDPYKYNITSSAEDWLWDPFDFEYGVINETADIVVSGTKTVTIEALQRWENPIIVSSAPMTVTFGGTEYEIEQGSQVMYDIIITAGTNTFVFNGNGTVTINYVGGML